MFSTKNIDTTKESLIISGVHNQNFLNVQSSIQLCLFLMLLIAKSVKNKREILTRLYFHTDCIILVMKKY